MAYFVDCTREHTPDEHTWGSCDYGWKNEKGAYDDKLVGCPCEGGWEE